MKNNKITSCSSEEKVFIAGGGTAGHVLPGIAIAQALLDREVIKKKELIHFVGGRRGPEADLVKKDGFEITLLPGRGLRRSVTPVNLLALSTFLLATVRAFRILRRSKPLAVVVMGGYAGIPCAIASYFSRIPVIVAEQNAIPGVSNRLVARFARLTAVSFRETDLPRAIWTGNPVRKQIREASEANQRDLARKRFKVDGKFMVTAFGGSLGSKKINEAICSMVEIWDGYPLIVHHVVGRRNWEYLNSLQLQVSSSVEYRPVEYEEDMASVLTASDLVIARSGATTVAELAVLGVPSILIPLPGAPRDHQTINAQRVVDVGGGVLIEDEKLNGNVLSEKLRNLLAEKDELAVMAESVKRLGAPEAADQIAQLIADCIGVEGAY